MPRSTDSVVYVVGAGLSAGLGFPTISNLLPKLLKHIDCEYIKDIEKIIRFHHPDFNIKQDDTYPTIEQILSEMKANADLFESTRPASGGFTSNKLEDLRSKLLYDLAIWFHDLKNTALTSKPKWLNQLVSAIKSEQAAVISFNWDLILDQLLFDEDLDKASYGLDRRKKGVHLIKPHGSLNWYKEDTARNLKENKKFALTRDRTNGVFAFRPLRNPRSSKGRQYMPLIVPPVYAKQFEGSLFRKLWQEAVRALSTASEVRFLGFSLAEADFHARFVLRCGFYNQENGQLRRDGGRAAPTGRSKVIVVDTSDEPYRRIQSVVGWECLLHKMKISDWIENGGLNQSELTGN